MQSPDITPDALLRKTRFAFLWTRLLNIPFWSILSLLSLILYKEMQISTLQIALFLSLKPLSALFAPYWSSSLTHRQDRVISHLVWANILRYLPFLFFPWIHSSWLIIFAFGFYMMLLRGVMPAWMEILKRNIQGMARERVCAYGSAVDYLGPALLPLAIGIFLDDYHLAWQWLFFATALIGLTSTFFLYRIPSVLFPESYTPPDSLSLVNALSKPWKESWSLVKEQVDFRKYLIGFMLGGSGLILMHSTLPMFFVDVLNLSYKEMAFAIALCKGIGFVTTSPLWVRLFRNVDIYYFSGLVTFLCALFPFVLIGSQYHLFFLYLSYLLYGFMQAGSELSWHMSGPHFSREKNSSAYSQTNVLTIGLRGCTVPFLGSLLYSCSNSTVVLIAGSCLCLVATERLLRYSISQKRLIAQFTTKVGEENN